MAQNKKPLNQNPMQAKKAQPGKANKANRPQPTCNVDAAIATANVRGSSNTATIPTNINRGHGNGNGCGNSFHITINVNGACGQKQMEALLKEIRALARQVQLANNG